MIKKYSRTDLTKAFFGITPRTFSANKEKYLNHLSKYYEWHKEGRFYILDREIQPWEPLKIDKGGRPKTADEIQKEYTRMMHEIIDNDPAQKLNSGANLTRNAKKRKLNQKFNHKDKTMSRYFCASINLEYPNAEKVWVKKRNEYEYEELTGEELDYLKALINNTVEDKIITKEELADIYTACLQDEISKQEAFKKLVGNFDPEDFYERVLMRFKQEKGFIPIRARRIGVNEITF